MVKLRSTVSATLGALILVGCGSEQITPSSSQDEPSSSSSSSSSSTSSSSSSSSSSASSGLPLALEEAQQGICSYNGAIEDEHSGFTGNGYINSLNATDTSITWRVSASETAQYQANIRYANGGASRTADLVINDGANGLTSLTFPTSTWINWVDKETTIQLNQGENDIELIATSSEGLANIDKLTLIGPSATAVSCETHAGSGNGSNNNSRKSACTQPSGTVYVSSPIVVSGSFDGNCQEYIATYGDGSQQEGQDPVFRVNGGDLRNIFVGPNGDGIHIYGNSTLTNITWRDVAEDALTIKANANLTISNFEAYSASDKIFQLNARSTFVAQNCTVRDMGKMFRENGGQCYPVNVSVNNCDISNASDAVFRSDCSTSNWTITNSNVSNASVCYSGTANCDSNPQ